MSLRVSFLLSIALIAFFGSTVVYGKDAEAGRPLRNMIPELYPDIYTGLTAEPSTSIPFADLPRDYNHCAHPQGGCTPSWNQHIPQYFPYCYLHASLSMAQDRLRMALHGKGVPDVTLARQDVLDCAGHYGFGANEGGGGEGVDVMEFMKRHGIVDETCNIYSGVAKDKCDPAKRCMNCMMLGHDRNGHCWPVEKYVTYKVKNYGFVHGEEQIMSEIFQRGPVSCGMVVDDEFLYNYAGGVYIPTKDYSKIAMDHDVEVVGWGEQKQVDGKVRKYWLVRNSHGTYFGVNGFFLLERGTNAMRIEEKCLFANMDVSELETHLRGENIGSMFGLLQPGQKPKTEPDNYKDMPQDIATPKEVRKEMKEEERVDKWIEEHVPQTPIQLSGSLVQNSTVAAKSGSLVKNIFLNLFSVAILAAIGYTIYSLCFRRRSDGYDAIPLN